MSKKTSPTEKPLLHSTKKQSDPTVFDQLLKPIDEFVKQQDSKLIKHHNQKFSYYDFFRLLMYFFIYKGESLRIFINTELNKGLLSSSLRLRSVPYSTFGEAFERYPVALFQAVFQHILSNVSFKQIPELATLGKLYCIDGSLFPVINSMLWAEYTSKNQSLKLHLCFELNRMIPVEFLVTAANYSERTALLKMMKSGITYIADRGYMSFKLCHQAIEKEAYFVFRTKSKLKYSVLESLDLVLPSTVKNIFNNVTDELITYTNDEFKHTYRLVHFYSGLDEFFILTNRFDLTTFQVIMLYAYRWQIELLFRFLKRTMNGIHLIKQDQRGVTIQFYVMLITSLLELHLKQIMIGMGNNESIEDVVTDDKKTVNNESKNDEIIEDKRGSDDEIKNTSNQDKDIIKNSKKEYFSSGYKFIETIGNNLNNYWKIGIHWLIALKHFLDKPFDQRVVEILNSS